MTRSYGDAFPRVSERVSGAKRSERASGRALRSERASERVAHFLPRRFTQLYPTVRRLGRLLYIISKVHRVCNDTIVDEDASIVLMRLIGKRNVDNQMGGDMNRAFVKET